MSEALKKHRNQNQYADWEKRLIKNLSAIGSTESAMILSESVTPRGRRILRLAPSTHLTNGRDCGGMRNWPTPTTRDWKDTGNVTFQRKDGKSRLDRVPMQMIATGETTGSNATTESEAHRTQHFLFG